jgi:hypothetical protein
LTWVRPRRLRVSWLRCERAPQAGVNSIVFGTKFVRSFLFAYTAP